MFCSKIDYCINVKRNFFIDSFSSEGTWKMKNCG